MAARVVGRAESKSVNLVGDDIEIGAKACALRTELETTTITTIRDCAIGCLQLSMVRGFIRLIIMDGVSLAWRLPVLALLMYCMVMRHSIYLIAWRSAGSQRRGHGLV